MNSVKSEFTIKVIPGPMLCDFDINEELHVSEGNTITFVNETDNFIMINFNDFGMLGSSVIFLNPNPDSYTLNVKSDGASKITCTVNCNYNPDVSRVTHGVKPTVVINRD